ncbi:MAG: hypothetical protein LPJ91_05855 [Pseudazoarcus pumilus]|nr:hypothetical protein [Pseudazoarcus pumilus]
MRLLAILILVLIVGWWASRALERPKRRPGAAPKKPGPERMLACAHCGVHIPESEGVRSEAGFFCCDDHRRLGKQGR